MILSKSTLSLLPPCNGPDCNSNESQNHGCPTGEYQSPESPGLFSDLAIMALSRNADHCTASWSRMRAFVNHDAWSSTRPFLFVSEGLNRISKCRSHSLDTYCSH